MDVLSAATETVANADAIAAAAATLSQGLPAAAPPSSSSAASSPRPKDDSEIDGDDEAPSTRSPESCNSVAPPTAAASGPVAAGPGMSPAARLAHAQLEAQAEDIRNGNHPKIKADEGTQKEFKRLRLSIAKENRDLLQDNFGRLRDAELRDSDVQTKVALERTQEELLDDVHQRVRKARVDGGLVPAKGSASGIGGEAGAALEKEGDKSGAGLLVGKKRARLLPARPFEKITPEAVLAKAEARRIRTVTLSDIEMRRDFHAIITDWRQRATKYLSTYNNSHWTKVTVSADSFRVRGVTFVKGDPVVVTSRVTGEEFHGEITVVKPKAVFLSLYGGVKTRIFVDHISTGRLTVARVDSKSVQ